jgi:hypothetical protein
MPQGSWGNSIGGGGAIIPVRRPMFRRFARRTFAALAIKKQSVAGSGGHQPERADDNTDRQDAFGHQAGKSRGHAMKKHLKIFISK